MSAMRISLLASFAAAALLATPARPCEPAGPSLDGPVAPEDGARGVPTNGKLHFSMFFGAADVRASVRADTAGEAINLDTDVAAGVTIVNLPALLPETSYVITLGLPESVSFIEGGVTRDINVVTGAGADTSAPTFDGEATVSVAHESGPGFFTPTFDCGGGGATNIVTVTAPAVADDVGIAGLKLIRVDDAGLRQLRKFEIGAALTSITDREASTGDYRYELVAVDLAGNESAPLDLDVSVSGCSAGGAGAPLVLALVVLLGRRRQARR
jgi:uncharacterized protein (TIGR03382 family)